MLAAVIDTNVFISALLGTANRPIIQALRSDAFKMITSDDLFNELTLVVNRSKIASRIPSIEKALLLEDIKRLAVFVKPSKTISVCRDVDDNMLLACALEGADVIVSHDEDVLVLNPFKKIAIITPKEFLKRLNG